jgi:hypothetical protein
MQFFMLTFEKARSVQSNKKRRARYQERLRHKAEELMLDLPKVWLQEPNKQLYSRTYYSTGRRAIRMQTILVNQS